MFVRRALCQRLNPTTVGWFGAEDQFAFDSGTLRLRGNARRFELGTPAVPPGFAFAGTPRRSKFWRATAASAGGVDRRPRVGIP